MNITILGAGVFGTALATVLEENQHHVTFFDPFKYPDITLEQTLATAETIVIATPTSAIPGLAPYLVATGKPIIIASKGLTDLSMFGDHPVSYISGPAFPDQIQDKRPTTLTSSSTLARSLFSTSWLHAELTLDNTGVMLCGSLKNVYALGAGMVARPDGYIQKAHQEMKLYLRGHDAYPSTADLACGIGDLTLTCTDTRSRNLNFGIALGHAIVASKQAIIPAPPELIIGVMREAGATTLESLNTLTSITTTRRYPLLRTIHGIITSKIPISTLIELTI